MPTSLILHIVLPCVYFTACMCRVCGKRTRPLGKQYDVYNNSLSLVGMCTGRDFWRLSSGIVGSYRRCLNGILNLIGISFSTLLFNFTVKYCSVSCYTKNLFRCIPFSYSLLRTRCLFVLFKHANFIC